MRDISLFYERERAYLCSVDNKKVSTMAKEVKNKVIKGVVKTYSTIEERTVGSYKAIENGVVGAYKAIENGVVGAYKKVENSAVKLGKSLTEEYKKQKEDKE
jgi:ferritin-like metal-binding protein YciE